MTDEDKARWRENIWNEREKIESLPPHGKEFDRDDLAKEAYTSLEIF